MSHVFAIRRGSGRDATFCHHPEGGSAGPAFNESTAPYFIWDWSPDSVDALGAPLPNLVRFSSVEAAFRFIDMTRLELAIVVEVSN